MQEGIFTKIGAVAAVIGVIVAIVVWLCPEPWKKIPDGTQDGQTIHLFDKNPLYTISSGADIKFRKDIHLPAHKDALYIQKGKLILNKEDVDEYDYVVILQLNKNSDKIRKIASGTSFNIVDSSRYGPEEREFRHAYVYLKLDNKDIDYLKCLGKGSSEYITIGQFRDVMKEIIDVNIPAPKEI